MSLKQFLAQPDNVRAQKAFGIINDPSRDPDELLLLLPLPARVAQRNGKARKSYLNVDLLGVCIDIAAPPPPPVVRDYGDHTVTKFSLFPERHMGDEAAAEHKLACFKILLNEGGLSAQGPVGKRVIDDALLKGWPMMIKFAQELRLPTDIYLHNTYLWMSSREILARAIEIGLNPRDPELIPRMVTYYGCSQTGSYQEPGGRDLVIRKLLEMGNKPDPFTLARQILSKVRYAAEMAVSGILDAIEAACDEPWWSLVRGTRPDVVRAAWLDWVDFCKLPHPEDEAEQTAYYDVHRVKEVQLRDFARAIPNLSTVTL